MKTKILAEIERLKRWNDNVRESTRHMTVQEEDYNRGKNSSYLELLDFINSLPKEPVSEDLEEAAMECIVSLIPEQELNPTTPFSLEYVVELLTKAFKAGSQWQKEQMMKGAIEGLVINDTKLTHGYDDIVFSMPKELKVGDKVKMIIVKL